MEAVFYSDRLRDAWEDFAARSTNATFLHTRRFLEYHGDRFVDRSVLVLHEGNVVGIMPIAVQPGENGVAASHPGATYGGLVHDGWLCGDRMIEALGLVGRHLRSAGFELLRYKPVPHIYSRAPAHDDVFALHLLGARRSRVNLSCAIDLAFRRQPTTRRRRGLKKALKVVELSRNPELLRDFWPVVEQNLSERHQARPAHSLLEIEELRRRFSDHVAVVVALQASRIEAGVVLFLSPRVHHAQYIASTTHGFAVSALDAVFDAAIADAIAKGARYFDFGTSNEFDGTLNSGLYRFKSEFGGGGVAYEHYELALDAI